MTGPGGQSEVGTGIWDHVDLERCQINTEDSIKTKGSSYGGYNLSHQPVQVGVGMTLSSYDSK